MTEFAIDIMSFSQRGNVASELAIMKIIGFASTFYTGAPTTVLVTRASGALGPSTWEIVPHRPLQTQVTYAKLNVLMTYADSSYALVNQAAAQPIFPAARDTITLQPGVYRMRSMFALATAATSMQTLIGFGGTATYTSFNWHAWYTSGAAALQVATQVSQYASSPAHAVLGAVPVNADTQRGWWMDGTFIVSVAGTFIPEISFSVAPGSCTVQAISHMEIQPLGVGFAQQGGWA